MKKKIQIFILVLFICGNAFVGIQTLFNHETYSRLEKRSYDSFEKTLDYSPLSKDFYDYLTNAFSDQLEYREAFINQYYTFTKKVLHNKYIGDVVIGKDDVLFSEPYVPADNMEQEIADIASLVNQQADLIAKSGSKLIYINYPRKDAVMTKYLPSFYNDYKETFRAYDQLLKKQLNKNVIYINLMDLLDDSKKYYYSVDHHLNIRGQEILFKYLNQIMVGNENDIHSLDDYKIEKIKMKGSFNRKIGYKGKSKLEELYLFPNGWDLDYDRYENGKKSSTKIMKKTKEYTCFMSGDFGETKIINHNQKDDFKLLFCGSSYLNSLEYLYIPSVSSFISLDYRHNTTGKTLVDYVREYHPQYVLYTSSSSVSSYSYRQHMLHFGLLSDDNNE